eukprot:6237438-Amphidinium_carterae.1
MQVIALDSGTWRRWVKKYIEADISNRKERCSRMEFHLEEPQVRQIEELDVYACDMCDCLCSTYRGLMSHRRQAHRVESTLACRVGSNV